jgi:ATP-dependent helicase IRC3
MLRPYQNDQLNAVLKNYIEGTTQQLLVAATGTGKTVLFSNLPAKMQHLLPGRTLVIVHREELVDQAIKSMKLWNPELKVGKEMAAHRADLDSDVIVSCVASIGRTGATRMDRFSWDSFDKIVIDEAHHGIASTYMNVLQASGVLQPGSKKLLLGVTATPKRKNLTRNQKKELTTLDDEDVISLKSVFKKIVHKYTIRQAIKDGWLVPLKGFRVKTKTDLSDVKSTGGDYQQDQLSEAVNTVTRNEQVVKAWHEYAERRSTIGFTVDIQHAKDMAELFRATNVKAEAVWGDDPLRAEKLTKYKSGHIEVLLNCQVLTEGFDAWQVRCVILAAPTKSASKYTQEVGRGTRLEEGTGNLLEALKAKLALHKTDCYVIDVVDNSSRCSLVTFPSLVGLNADFDLQGKSVTDAIDEIEALQDKNPGVDFTHLTDLSKVKVYVESLDMFAEPYTAEVVEFSELTWMLTADGSYTLSVPEDRLVKESKQYWNFQHEKLHIVQNELEEYVLSITTTNSDRELGIFTTLKEAFATADEVVRRCRADRVKLMKRTETWHKNPATDPAKKYLAKLTKKTSFLFCLCPGSGVAGTVCSTCKKQQGLTAGQAALAINKLSVK